MKWIICSLICFMSSGASAEMLTQAEFDQQLNAYTKIINESKKLLDSGNQQADAEAQKAALCRRLSAYHAILALAEAHAELESAAIMKYVASRYLERQKQSLDRSGMTERFVCGS